MQTAQQVKILDCDVVNCAYNRGKECHAYAITVGGPDPACDTYFIDPKKGGIGETGCVGACRVKNCSFNTSLECSAQGIEVSYHLGHADCKTFQPR